MPGTRLILIGRRAKKYVSIGRRRIAAYKLAKIKEGSSAIKVPAGRVIARTSKIANIDTIMVKVRDPYIWDYSSGELVGSPNGAFFIGLGGATGEPFLRDLPTNSGSSVPGFPTYFVAHQLLSVKDQVYTWTTPDAGKTHVYMNAVAKRYTTGSPPNGQYLFYHPEIAWIDGYAVAGGYACVGEDDNNVVQVGMSFTLGYQHDMYDYGTNNRVSYVLYSALYAGPGDALTPVWPLTSINGGWFHDVQPVYLISNVGRGKLAWFQWYINATEIQTVGDHEETVTLHLAENPEMVICDVFNNTYLRLPLQTLVDFGGAHSGVLVIFQNDIVLSSADHLFMVFTPGVGPQTNKQQFWRSTNGGSSWTPVVMPHMNSGSWRMAYGGGGTHNMYCYKEHTISFLAVNPSTFRFWTFFSEDDGATWEGHEVNNTLPGEGGDNQFPVSYGPAVMVKWYGGKPFYIAKSYGPIEGSVNRSVSYAVWEDYSRVAPVKWIQPTGIVDTNPSHPGVIPANIQSVIFGIDAHLHQAIPGLLEKPVVP